MTDTMFGELPEDDWLSIDELAAEITHQKYVDAGFVKRAKELTAVDPKAAAFVARVKSWLTNEGREKHFLNQYDLGFDYGFKTLFCDNLSTVDRWKTKHYQWHNGVQTSKGAFRAPVYQCTGCSAYLRPLTFTNYAGCPPTCDGPCVARTKRWWEFWAADYVCCRCGVQMLPDKFVSVPTR